MTAKSEAKDLFLRGLAILGLIALLLLGAWGIIQIAVNLPGFLSGVGSSFGSLFAQREEVTTMASPAPTASTPAPSATQTTKPQNTSGASSGTTYISAKKQSVQLWGYPDLAVRVLSTTPGTRASIQFEVKNDGTNVAQSGWTFNANLPVGYAYTYTADQQQALSPGDKIVYTLSFDVPYSPYQYGQYQYGQYQYGNQYNYNYNYPYGNYSCGYVTEYIYNGYYNYPTQKYKCGYGQNFSTYNLPAQAGYQYGYPQYSGRTVTISVDPYNAIYELNEGNNTTSVSI